ncbi:AAA family ATPase [Planctomyces sp. SH-PL14]|uniref:AAA family ATPase n=1 Tax=Planctomyces sp. SH-PL14 TaxID=1632864 RepID=UPI00078CC85D|nr:AAA family ATPase [Planctomyces sp. SH-PL14]AMV16583.1 hypothetical protein VT03_01755 [Planctomyces sp. SH-PL14]
MVVSGATATANGLSRKGNCAADAPEPIQPRLTSEEELEELVLAGMSAGQSDDELTAAEFSTQPGRTLFRVIDKYRGENGLTPPPHVTRHLLAADRSIPDPLREELTRWLDRIEVEVSVPFSIAERHWETNVRALLDGARRKRALRALEAAHREVEHGGDLAVLDRLSQFGSNGPRGFRLEGVPLGRFLKQRTTTQYLVQTEDGRGLLARGQVCLAAGASKSLKTSIIGCDLGLALATGTPFLGEFPTVRSRVALLSGESGGNAIRACFDRIIRARNLDVPDDFDGLVFEQSLPRVSEPGHLKELHRFCLAGRFDVIIADPCYWMLANERTESGAGNLFTMGSQLQRLRDAIPDGVTLILIHHFSKTASRNGRESGEPPQMEDMSQAGFAEFARQWALIGRRSKYDGESGTHHLWLNVGGSEGHSGLWGVDIREGRQSDLGGRRWAATVRTREEVEVAKEEQADDAKEIRQDRQMDRHKAAVVKFMTLRGAVTLTDLKDAHGVRYQTARRVLQAMSEAGEAVSTKIHRENGRSYDGFALSGSHYPAPVPGTGHPLGVPAPSERRAGNTPGGDMSSDTVPHGNQ